MHVKQPEANSSGAMTGEHANQCVVAHDVVVLQIRDGKQVGQLNRV